VRIGRVAELWRHPVKSLGGERIVSARLDAAFGVPGDRSWALFDEREGELRSAKKLPGLLGLSARCLAEPDGGEAPPIELLLPDGARVRGDDANAAERISRALGRPLRLCARRPASDLAHYRRARPIEDFAAEIRAASELLPDEPVPELSRSTRRRRAPTSTRSRCTCSRAPRSPSSRGGRRARGSTCAASARTS
jgi:hypothetical protein